MISKKIATLLDGMECDKKIPKQDLQYAKENKAVIVFGASGDLTVFRGAIEDEISCYDRGQVFLDKDGLIKNKCSNENCPYFKEKLLYAKVITKIWDLAKGSWGSYATDIPHETFEIFEEGQKYCRGIVFSLEDLK